MPDFSILFEVHTDALYRAIGGVLVQEGHSVAFESWKLKDCELRYNVHDKEMTAVVHCLEIWRHYLMGTRFTVVTDNLLVVRVDGKCLATVRFTKEKHELIDEARDNLVLAQKRMKGQADKGRRDVQFQIGTWSC
nr:Retrovirus-related Pol polyprotein from transposon 17.6 [Ipomoea trifida]